MIDYVGMVWHWHHSRYLAEFCYSLDERVEFIDKHKPEHERALRKQLLKPVLGDLPRELVAAGKARYDLWKACVKAREAYAEAGRKAYANKWQAYKKACKAYDTWRAYDKIYNKHLPLIEKLHQEECPNCPWDGNTIFPEEAKND